ncbi:helix-turn-helix transcriptional regulator [Nocardia alni]|uniref:helix-turn-helix transcriptional regulator n=1 Tax=Nocardia alni TaxID=2815723 RepID=UPI001C24EF68|nr:helix-turn-helix transcriptional regulator [Nocardia alni]
MSVDARLGPAALPVPARATHNRVNHAALGNFLRARRALVTPDQAGVVTTGYRRVSGLRREELAELAGVSVHYLTRLEQGRDRHPSPQVQAALARALCLDDSAFGYLRRLAEPPAVAGAPALEETLEPATAAIIDGLTDHVALVLGRYRDVLAATPLATVVCPGFAVGQNILRYVFLTLESRDVYLNWEEVAVEAVRTLRAAAGPEPHNERLRSLVTELTVGSPEFAALWARHEVRKKTIGAKRFRHPIFGEIALSYTSLTVNNSMGQTLSVYRAEPGSDSERSLERLRSDMDASAFSDQQ